MHRRTGTKNEDPLGRGASPLPAQEDEPPPSSQSLGGRKSHPESEFKALTAAAAELNRDVFFTGSLKIGCSWGRWGMFLGTCVLLGLWLMKHDSVNEEGEGFVSVSGLQFEKDCRPFYVAGFNAHDVVTAAMLTPSEYKMAGGKSGRDMVRRMFSQAAQSGLSVVRTWVHTDDPQFPFQVEPGVYNEKGFAALDFILDEAHRNGLKVLLCLVDNWKYYNGVDQFVDWSTTTPERTQQRPADKWGDANTGGDIDEETKAYEVTRHALFYNDTGCRNLYKQHIYAIVNRQNSFNGRLYRDDPTILGWDLLNEPRCESWRVENCGRLLQDWIEEMVKYIKSQDPNHLVTIGSEGFFKLGSSQEYLNPQEWAGAMGQDFLLNHIPNILDFATIHVWPDTWNRKEDQYEGQWIMSHVDTASFQLGKPVLVEEFGKKLSVNRLNPSSIRVVRDPVFGSVYRMVENLIADGHAIGGSLFWRWDLPMFHDSDRSEYGVYPEDSTFGLVTQHTTFVNRWISSQPPRKECNLGCWVPHKMWNGQKCENIPSVCTAYWDVLGQGNSAAGSPARNFTHTKLLVNDRLIPLDGLQVYPSHAACCRPGSGAFPKGCSWTTWVWS